MLTALANLVAACGGAIQDTKAHQQESRGRPKSSALHVTVRGLRETFATFYDGDADTQRTRYGAVKARSEREADEFEFVKTALADADIPCTKRRLEQVFLEPDAMP
jgi:hypothetical protein